MDDLIRHWIARSLLSGGDDKCRKCCTGARDTRWPVTCEWMASQMEVQMEPENFISFRFIQSKDSIHKWRCKWSRKTSYRSDLLKARMASQNACQMEMQLELEILITFGFIESKDGIPKCMLNGNATGAWNPYHVPIYWEQESHPRGSLRTLSRSRFIGSKNCVPNGAWKPYHVPIYWE